jgi:hypothetical protein
MRKLAFLVAALMLSLGLHAQEKTVVLHRNGQVLYQTPVSNIGGIGFLSNPASIVFSNQQGATLNTIPVSEIDSVTFGTYEIPSGDQVVINFNGNTAEIVNPFANDGVSVETAQGNVTVYSTKTDVPYLVTGSSTNSSLTVYSNSDFAMTLSYLTLTSTTTAAINLASNVNATLTVEGTCNLTDGANSSINGACYAAGNLTVNGNDLLRITGNAKHGLLVDGDLTVNNGTIDILDTDSDGIHVNGAMHWNGGTLHIVSAGSDGLDVSGDIIIHDGELEINTNAESARGIKVSGIFDMADGHLTLNTIGNDGKGLKCDSTLVIRGGVMEVNVSGEGSNGISSDQHISIEGNADITIVSNAYDGKCFKSDNTFSMSGGSLHLTHSGDLSKGIKTVGEINIGGGSIDITASGSTVMEVVNNANVPAYCTAIKSDTDIVISGGTFHINLPTTNHGGKSISADGNLTITGGDFTIETHGNGAAYTVSGNTKDSYTSSCLKSDGNMVISAGTFNLTSTGTGGKGINTGGTLVIGTANGYNNDLILNVTTSGERITVTSGGGGPWGGGDYANPKAIKAQGNLTINSGTLRVNCTQTQNEGGECIESKAIMTINGGDIEAYSKKDDAVNASSKLIINGGVYYAHSDANDGTDCNGQMELNGGFCISNGAKAPEEGFDCDNNQFKITGGTHIGTGGGTSNPTTSVCTQPTLKINTQQNYAIQILKSDGTVICTYQCPAFTGGGGGGWPGGGGNGMVMLFTDPQLQTGQSYTIKYNGTISGGTNWNGYYTGNVNYSGGSTVNVNVNSMYTNVNAGGNGW